MSPPGSGPWRGGKLQRKGPDDCQTKHLLCSGTGVTMQREKDLQIQAGFNIQKMLMH